MLRSFQAEPVHDVELLGCGEEQILATYHFRYAHESIVYSYGKLLCPRSLTPADYAVTAMVRQRYLLVAEQYIIKWDDVAACGICARIGWNHEPQDVSVSDACRGQRRRTAFATIDYVAVGFMRSLCGHQFGSSAVAGIYYAL